MGRKHRRKRKESSPAVLSPAAAAAGSAACGDWRRDAWIALLFGAAAFLIRLAYLWDAAGSPTFLAPTVDAYGYHEIASRLARTGEWDQRFFYQPFFYPTFLAAVYRLTDCSIVWGRIAQAVVGALATALGYWQARRLFGRSIAVAAAALLAGYGVLVFYQTELLGTGWAVFWALALVELFQRTRQTARWPWLAALGVAAGLSVITRPTFLPFLVLSTLWLLYCWRCAGAGPRALGLRAALVLAGFLAVSIPVASLSRAVVGEFSFLPGNGSLNLYIGNNPQRAETVTARPGPDYKRLVDLPLQLGSNEYAEQNRFFQRRVWRYATHQPLDFAAGLAAKALQFVSAREIPNSENIYLQRRWSVLLRPLVWQWHGFGFPFGLCFPLAVIGMVAYSRALRGPLGILLVTYPAAVILVHVCARYRAPVLGPMILFAAAGAAALVKYLQKRDWRRVGLACTALIGLVLLTTLPGPFPLETLDHEADLYHGVGVFHQRAGKLETARDWFRRAAEKNPVHAEAHNNLAAALSLLGDSEAAVPELEAALAAKPYYAEARMNLAAVLAASGRRERALREYETLLTEPLAAKVRIRVHMAELCIALKRDEATVAHYRAALAAGGDSGVRRSLALELFRQGRFAAAVQEYELLTAGEADNAALHNNLGAARARTGNLKAACTAFQRAVALNPNDVQTRCNLAAALARLGRETAAAPHYEAALRLDPGCERARQGLAALRASEP